MIPDLQSLAGKLEVERQAITGLVQGLDDATLDRPGPDGAWSVRETLAHIVASEEGLLSLAQRIARGENPQPRPDYNLDDANAREVDKRRGLHVPALLDEWQRHRAEWAVFLESVTPEQLGLQGAHPRFEQQVTLLQLVIVMLKHERNHKQEIMSLLSEC